MSRCCGNCKFNKRSKDEHGNTEFICTNEESEYYAVPTDYNDWCDEFEEKE